MRTALHFFLGGSSIEKVIRSHLFMSSGGKALVAYFSWGGNTRTIAGYIHQAVGGDLFEIKTVNAYPTDYNATTDVAKREQGAKARPALASTVDAIDSYNVLFLGYPNWWGTIPMPVYTFLESFNLAGKTIIPFCTNEGSGLGRSVADIKAVNARVTVRDGLAVRGGGAARAKDQVIGWLRRLGVVK
jgi:flavodoxin